MASEKNGTVARLDGVSTGYTPKRMFDHERPRTLGQALRFGMLTGSAITVVMLLLALALGAGFGQWNQGMAYCLSFIVAGVAGGVLQQAWFNPNVMLKIRYPARMVGFALTYLIVLSGCSYFGAWMPMDNPGAWIGFIGIFAVIFATISIIFSIRYRKEGSTYDELLAEYRAKRRDDEHDTPR